MTFSEINDHLIQLVKSERKITHEILTHILLFKKCDGHVRLGYSSMMAYLTRHLGYSDDQAYRRLKAAQLLDHVPQAASQLKNGKLNLSQAAQTQRALETAAKENSAPVTEEKKTELIEALAQQNNFETQKILSETLNLTPQERDHIRPQSNQTIRFETQLSQSQFEKFKKIKSLLSHKCPDQKAGDILEVLFDFYLEKNDPTLPKRSPSQEPITKTTQGFMVTKKHSGITSSRYIPVQIKQEVWQRSKGRCEYISLDGIRCESTYQLQYDHIQPLARGGLTEFSNIRHLCKVHNLHEASQRGIGFETIRQSERKAAWAHTSTFMRPL